MDKDSTEKKFKAMKMPELKKFLQDYGITVNSYLKPGLVALLVLSKKLIYRYNDRLPRQKKTYEI